MMTEPLFPRTYRMMSGVRAFMLAIAALIMGGSAVGIYFEAGSTPIYAVILLLFGLVAAGGAFMAHYFLSPPIITLTRHSIELRTTIARRELFKYEIVGYRLKERFFGNATITLIPSESRDKAIKISRYIQRDHLFEEWLLSLRGLNEAGEERSQVNISGDAGRDLNNEEYAVPSSWAAGAAMALSVAGACCAVWAVFVPNLSDGLLIILASAPILAVTMMIVWPAYFRLDIRGDGTRRSLLFLFILPGIALAWRADSDMELAGWETPAAAAAAVALVMAGISRAAYRRSSETGTRLAVLFVLMLPYGFGLTLMTNSKFDTSEAQVFSVTVEDKHYTRARFTSPKVVLAPWGARSTASSISVPYELYERLNIGMAATVRLSRGALHMPYYTLHPLRRARPNTNWDALITDLDAGVAAYGKGEYQAALKLLRKPAENGDDEAQFFVGMLYRDGKGTARDTAAAMRLFRLAADQGYARAINAVGYAYDSGIGAPQDVGKAIEWYRKAVAANDPGALTNLGILYFEGRGVPQDYDHAGKLWLMAAEYSYGPAMNQLGLMYANGTGVARNMRSGLAWWTRSRGLGDLDAAWYLGRHLTRARATAEEIAEGVPMVRDAAQAGNGDAAFVLSLLYLDGRGVTKNATEGLKWLDRAIELDYPPAMLERGGRHARDGQPAAAARLYRMAAEKGYARAQAYLGQQFADGNGVARDLVEAVKWYERAAAQGDAMGQRMLAYTYDAGLGLDKNPQEAARLYRLAARQGDVYSAESLAHKLLYGLGIPQDRAEGHKWVRMAAERGSPISMNNLASMLDRGEFVGRDVTAAFDLYRRAAAHGQANAAHSLATHYFTGRSIERDIGEAYYWMLIAEIRYSAAERPALGRLKRAILEGLPTSGVDRAAIEQRAGRFQPLPVPVDSVPPAKPYKAAWGR